MDRNLHLGETTQSLMKSPGRVPSGTIATLLNSATVASLDDKLPEPSFHDLALLGGGAKIQFSEDGVYTGSGGFGETRMNRSTYDFIRRECLWSKEGMQRYGASISRWQEAKNRFSSRIIEVKAAWLDFEEQKIPADKQSTYYTAEYQGKKYGLTTLHIITKDIPNWFWATFHHVDQPNNPFEIPGDDKSGRPKILVGTVWQNYVLGGTQIEFESSIGLPKSFLIFMSRRDSKILMYQLPRDGFYLAGEQAPST